MSDNKREASYIELHRNGTLKEREWKAKLCLENCRLCPRKCGVDRTSGEAMYCKGGELPKIAAFGSHFGEEEVISGTRGSGTIFFTGCTLSCLFCQNYEISHLGEGREYQETDLSSMMLDLQKAGCHNINLVSPTHFVPQIIGALNKAAEKGFNLPLVYNAGGYENVETIRLLDGIVDIYMPDIKFGDDKTSRFLSDAQNYTHHMKAALKEMYRQTGDLELDENGIAKRGLLIRHLVLPENLSGTNEVFRFISEEISKDTYVSIMSQYTPAGNTDFLKSTGLFRKITDNEYREAKKTAHSYGLHRGFS
ncbi:4Fe-4S cluster-binding domain-containing protein [Methanoplanus sp. FWC-SCC4]|uniref:4Fe-4S cluster-binding domain-containing protein n=1 Tax=Methanochimaera problematica TaxID=2609417 RepID=A0AA97I592_9EURY|nr:radical SAM protein [Methanoplanus sp. FWC-SCC4]WOF17206.1 4Fe-4S cluster-binding domain-containing protein [Methanoplanus sp. FWC-SCC4]